MWRSLCLTYHDSLEGHSSWWVRIERYFPQIPADKKRACDAEAKEAVASSRGREGIPYTIHQVHVTLCPRCAS
jgi:hypothetical protein